MPHPNSGSGAIAKFWLQSSAHKITRSSTCSPIAQLVRHLSRSLNDGEIGQLPSSLVCPFPPPTLRQINAWSGPHRTPKLASRVQVVPTFTKAGIRWVQSVAQRHHYMHKAVFPRAKPLGYTIWLDGKAVGIIVVATIHFTKQKGRFGYTGLPTQWQVLCLNRLWLHPEVQNQVVIDRKGKPHKLCLASCALGKLLDRIGQDWLEHKPPRDISAPYQIRLMMSYCDEGRGFKGTVYKAAGFQKDGYIRPRKQRKSSKRGVGNNSLTSRWIRYLPESESTQPPLWQGQLKLTWTSVTSQLSAATESSNEGCRLDG